MRNGMFQFRDRMVVRVGCVCHEMVVPWVCVSVCVWT